MLKVRVRSCKRKIQDHDDHIPESTQGEENFSPHPSRHAANMKKYRRKMKEERPLEYNAFRSMENDRSRNFRANMGEEKRKQYNEKAKLRMRKMRERQKLGEKAALSRSEAAGEATTLQTRSMEEKMKLKREQQKIRKREWRAKLSAQKKRRIREKDARYQREKRARSRPETGNTGDGTSDDDTAERVSFTSDAARRKAIWRAQRQIPSNSKKGAEVLGALVSKASPRKKEYLKKEGIISNKSLQQKDSDGHLIKAVRGTCEKLGYSRRREFAHALSSRLDYVHGLKTKACHALGFNQKYLLKYAKLRRLGLAASYRKKRSDATPANIKRAIVKHFTRPDVSTEMPNKKGQKVEATRHVLQRSITATHASFKEDNPGVKVARSTFAALRPKNVLTQSHAKLFQCLCEYCANVELKLEALNKSMYIAWLGDKYDICKITLCDHEGKYPRIACVDRKCSSCGVGRVKSMLTKALGTRQLRWRKWCQMEYPDGKTRIGRKWFHGTGKELATELAQELLPFSQHLFQARWQQDQFYKVINNLPLQAVVLVMDYAENYSVSTQHEVQGGHWYQQQVTIHPMIAYFKCPDPTCNLQTPVREIIDIISEDNKHDSSAVHYYTAIAATHLIKVRGITVQRLIQYSDGCSGQYKSKTPFTDLSFGSEDLGIPTVERHFFGSRHGKNPCDGEGGVLKNCADRAVRSEKDVEITSAEDFFLFAKSRLSRGPVLENFSCNHSRRVFYFVSNGDVDRNRPSRTQVSTLPGTRLLHAAVGLGEYSLKTRRLSCFCDSCNGLNDETCPNIEYVGKWTKKKMRLMPGVPTGQSGKSLPTSIVLGKLSLTCLL